MVMFTLGSGSAIDDEFTAECGMILFMIAFNAHFDGKVIVPDEPLSLVPNQPLRITIETVSEGPVFTPYTDLTAALMNGDTWDETDALHVDRLDATPANFVRRPGTAAGQIKMADDFNDTPAEFEEHL